MKVSTIQQDLSSSDDNMNNREESYECCRCNLQTKYPYRLQMHLEVHKLKDTLTCTACGIVFQNMKSLTIWHSKNNLKGHLDTEEMVKKTADCKELLKQSGKSPQHKQRNSRSQQDRLNVVMFRNSAQSDAGLESKAKEIVEFSDSRHKETKELKKDRDNTNNTSLGNSLIHPALAKLENSRIESANSAAEILSVTTLMSEESESLSNVSDAEHETSECPPNIILEGCNDNEIHVQDSEKGPVACIASDIIDTKKILNSERKTVNIENNKMPVLEKENNSTSAKFHCSQCNFRTKYKNFWKLHKHVHMSKDSVTCEMCNIMFSSNKSMVVWHAKNGLQEHVYLSTLPKVNGVPSKMKIRSNPLKRYSKLEVEQDSFQIKSRRRGQLRTDLDNIETDIALDLSVIKEEPNETEVEMFDNQESSGYPTGKCKIAGTCKGHHFGGLDKVYFNAHNDSLYCDDLVSNADSLQRKSDFPEEIHVRMAISRTALDDSIADGNINDLNNYFRDRITNCSATDRNIVGSDNELSEGITIENVDDGSKNGAVDGEVNDSNDRDTGDNVQNGKSSNDKDLNNNELGGNGCEGNDNSEFRDENNNMNKESGDDGDENDKFFNENMGSPKHIELLICLVCQTSFNSKVLLIKHLVKVHNLTNLCRLCYFKDNEIKKFANPVSLRNHRLRCHENEMKPCVCGSLFLDYHTLASHLKKFKCTQKEHPDLQKCICGKRFTSEKELNSHKFLKCRKRKLTKSDKGHNSKVNRTDRTESECVSESAGTTLDLKEWPSQTVKQKKKRKSMKDIRNANSISENIGEGNGLNKDLNNNVVDDFMEHKENALNIKNENRRVKCKESKFPMNKNRTVHRKLRENKTIVCKACFARFKPCDCFYHQKVCHQKRTGTDSMKKSGLRSGKEITIDLLRLKDQDIFEHFKILFARM